MINRNVQGLRRGCSWRADADAPIACTADLANERVIRTHVDDYRAAFADLIGGERFPGGFRWRFRATPGLEARLKELAEREHGCCRFMSFELRTDRDQISWETTADQRAAPFLDEFFRLPERLREEQRPGHDVSALKRCAEAAGLQFTADD